MHILIIPSWYKPEGGQFCLTQAKALQDAHCKVAILANVTLPWHKYKPFHSGYPMYKMIKEQDEGVTVYKRYGRRIPHCTLRSVIRWSVVTKNMIKKYIQLEGRPDMIHIHSYHYGGLVGIKLKKEMNLPYVITEHMGRFTLQSELACRLLQVAKWEEKLISESYKQANAVIAVSDQLISGIHKFAPHTAVQIISNIVDVDFFSPPIEKKRNDVFTFVCTNGYCPEKGYDILLQAIDLLIEDHQNFRIIIAGDLFDSSSYQELLPGSKYAGQVITYVGLLNRQGIRNLLWQADAFLLPSRVEAEPVSLLEAMSTGLPVVCTDVISKQIVYDESGIMTPNEHPKKLAEGMKEMMQKYKTYNTQVISQSVRHLAASAIIADKLKEVYKKCLKEK